MQFAQKISTLMRSRGLSQRSLAEALHTSNATVAGWCNGAKPRAAVVKRVADYFGVPVDVLVDDSLELPAAEPPVRESPAAWPQKDGPQDYEALIAAALEKLPAHVSEPIRADFQAHLAKFDAQFEKKIAALDERIASLDATLAKHPVVAEALEAGLTLDEIRALIRARRDDSAKLKLAALKEAARDLQKERPEGKDRRHA